MSIFFNRWALLSATWLPAAVLAAGTAVVGTGNDATTIQWQDPNTLRFNIPEESAYMLMRDGKVYMVSQEAGAPPVMEVSGMLQGLSQAGAASAIPDRIDTVTATGKGETVAGIKGEVYRITITDQKGKTEAHDAVLTNDQRVVEMTQAFLTLFGNMAGTDRMNQVAQALPADKRGVLRMDKDVVLQSINAEAPPADAFTLPAPPVDVGSMLQDLMKSIPQK